MGDLRVDSAVDGGEGRYTVDLSDEWQIIGPNGGYLACVALRAVGAESRFSRPASISCQFFNLAQVGPAEVHLTPLRQAKRSELLRATLVQDGRPIMEAAVWMIDELGGLEHDRGVMPDLPHYDELPTRHNKRRDIYSLYGNIDERPIKFIEDEDWDTRPIDEPRVSSWFRLKPAPTFPDDQVLDACRSLILSDAMPWPAAVRAHTGNPPWLASSIEMSLRFHRFAPDSEWLLCDTLSPVAAHGLIGSTMTVWSADGLLLATGGQNMLCRPFPPPGG
jgi:acyl-CoA thioesterase